MDTQAIFKDLNEELKKQAMKRELIICGGAALISMGVISRRTRDVDVIKPELDDDLLKVAEIIAGKHELSEDWLNNGPAGLAKDLPGGWEKRCVTGYEGSNLEIRMLGRMDLIRSKLYAACDQSEHLQDLVELKVTEEELKEAETWVLEKDASALWPEIVRECIKELKNQRKDE